MKSVKSLVLFLLFGFALNAVFAQDEPSIHGTRKADPVFQEHGLAIRGFDPVAYFDQQKPLKGKKEFEYRYRGASWRFSSADNRERFSNDPEKYAPQYGGYCAYGMSHGYAAPIDPEAWSIIEGKLYLNYNLDIQSEWNKNIPGYILKANENWPRIPKKEIQE